MNSRMSDGIIGKAGGRALLHYFILAFAIVAVAALSAAAVPASANNGMTKISGVGYIDFDGVCVDYPVGHGVSDYAVFMEGDLAGCVYVYIDFENTHCTPSGVYNETGLEIYDITGGDLGMVGTFDSDYRFTGKFGDGTCEDLSTETFGRCQHPIVPDSGTGDFVDVTGRLDFKDDVELGCSYYRGHMRLP